MKKQLLLTIALGISAIMSAQVTIYESCDYINPSYLGGDTIYNIPAYIRLPYGALDSIKPFIVNSQEDKVTTRFKTGSSYLFGEYFGSDNWNWDFNHFDFYCKRNGERDSFSLPFANIDSISYLSIPTQSIEIVDTIILPFQYNRPYVKYGLNVDPLLSTDVLRVSVVDPSIIGLKSESWNSYNDLSTPKYWSDQLGSGNGGCRSFIQISPLKVGQTQVSLQMGNKSKNIAVIIKTDTTNYTADELYERVFNRLYITGDSLPSGSPDIDGIDEGTTSFYRMVHEMQEFSADHVWWIWPDVGIADIRAHTWTASNTFVNGLYRRLYYNIHLCNAYLDKTANETSNQMKVKRAEVQFMRAFYYYYVLDMFGRGPILTSELNADYSSQANRSQLFTFIVNDLQTLLADLPAPGQKAGCYRVDKAAAWLLLSRIYLNAEVYNGSADWVDASLYANSVIQSSASSLTSNYKNLFMGDNDSNGAMDEMLLAARVNGVETASWGGSKYLICAFSGWGMGELTGLTDSWTCGRTQKRLTDLFFPNGTTATGTADSLTIAAGDDRALFCNHVGNQSWKLPTSYTSTNNSDFYACWALQKFTNVTSYGGIQASNQWPDTDLPLLRKAEAYLTYAEAQFRMGHTANALSAINTLRARSHAAALTSLTEQDILDEWGREFYAEGRRRTDLVRFGKFGGTNGYTWEGKTRDFDSHYNVYPIPQDFMDTYPSYEQNIGY